MSKFKHHLRSSINISRFTAVATLTIMLASVTVKAQAPTVFATGLKAPAKIIPTGAGSLLVAESGDGPNTGRVSVVDRDGNRRTLLDGLPAGLSAPFNEPDGPAGLALCGRTLFIAIGVGDAVVNGPLPGTEVPNPAPASPILSSVITLDFSRQVDDTASGFVLSPADHASLAEGNEVVLSNGAGDQVTIKLIANFPDYVSEPRPDFAANVRPSHPYGLEVGANDLYIVDAALNSVVKVDLDSGAFETLAIFPPQPNPLFPSLGPPVSEVVPDSIRLHRGSLLVTSLTGFPFAPGVAGVRKINVADGTSEPFITNLSSAIDVLPVKGRRSADDRFYVLEFSADQLAQAPGRLSRFESPAGPPTVIAGDLVTPTSLARDPRTGDLFVTEYATGRVMRVEAF